MAAKSKLDGDVQQSAIQSIDDDVVAANDVSARIAEPEHDVPTHAAARSKPQHDESTHAGVTKQ
jgi:hypothetical protein